MCQTNYRRFTFLRSLIAVMSLLAASSYAAGPLESNPTPTLLAQNTSAPSTDKIRAQAQRMKEYRALLADPDSNVRLAALDEMLKSSEAALRELAFEAGFASADQNMRALALRARILSMKGFVLELQNAEKLDNERWQKVTAQFGGLTRSFTIKKVDAQTGNIDIHYCPDARVTGQEFSFSCGAYGTVRLRLTDGAVMIGTISSGNLAAPVTLTLQ
jgi:hypothetical protein